MQKIEVVVRRSRVADMREAFREVGIAAVLVSDLNAPANPGERTSFYRGMPYAQDVALARVESIVADDAATTLADAIGAAARARGIDEGHLAVTAVGTLVNFAASPMPSERNHRPPLRRVR